MAWKRNPVLMSLFSRDSRKPQQLCALCPISLLIWSAISLLKIVCYFPNVLLYKNVFMWQRILTHYELKCESINKFYFKIILLRIPIQKEISYFVWEFRMPKKTTISQSYLLLPKLNIFSPLSDSQRRRSVKRNDDCFIIALNMKKQHFLMHIFQRHNIW